MKLLRACLFSLLFISALLITSCHGKKHSQKTEYAPCNCHDFE
jgi:hypothetical protein